MPFVWDSGASDWKAGEFSLWILPTVNPSAIFLAESHSSFTASATTTEKLNSAAAIFAVFKLDYGVAVPTLARVIEFGNAKHAFACGAGGTATRAVCGSAAGGASKISDAAVAGCSSRLLFSQVTASCDGGVVGSRVYCDNSQAWRWAHPTTGAAVAVETNLYVRVAGAGYNEVSFNFERDGAFLDTTCAKLR
jgi:hypothetical protein